jgi:hypothetical protein
MSGFSDAALQLFQSRQDDYAVVLLAAVVALVITLMLCGQKTGEQVYRYDPRAPPTPTRPTHAAGTALPDVKHPCTCGTCCLCNPLPDPLEIAAPGKDADVAAPFGYGLTALPVDVPDPVGQSAAEEAAVDTAAAKIAAHGFALPMWMTRPTCAGCVRPHNAVCFLCPLCQQVAGRPRVHQVFELLEEGDESRAWTLANAILRDVIEFRLHAPFN